MNKEKKGCLIWGTIIFAPFFLLGGGFLYGGFISPYLAKQSSSNWVQTPCVILASEVKRHESRDNQSGGTDYTFSIEVSFSYEYDGQTYTSDRYDFTDVFDATEDWKREVVSQLPAGAETACFVNPVKPSEAVLSRESPLSLWGAIPAAVFTLFGFVGLLFTFSTLFERSKDKSRNGS